MIDSTTNVGLEYDDVDPFATPPGPGTITDVPKHYWINGWYINITYFHYQLNTNRTIWAGALFADLSGYGSPDELWLHVMEDTNNDGLENFLDKGYKILPDRTIDTTEAHNGGRKTNGTAVTEPITIIYNGPRRFIALLNTTIFDHMDNLDPEDDVPLVRIYITLIFNKVKKQVILIKDVKSLLPWKTGDKLRIQFSNRGQVDLGNPEDGYVMYAHFFTEGTDGEDTVAEGQDTVYHSGWQYDTTNDVDCAVSGMPQGPPTATFDVAQVINPDAAKVFYAAFWPSCSDWEIDGFGMWWRSLSAGDPHSMDLDAEGPGGETPFYIGEWDFILDNTKGDDLQFRGVTVYGVVDWKDAQDINMGNRTDAIETEAIDYQLKQIFNPWSLCHATNPAHVPRSLYNWTVVGVDISATDPGARTPDVAGASLVAAAIKNKGFELNTTGLDRMDRAGQRIPYVMYIFSPPGTAWTDYIDALMRPALEDYICGIKVAGSTIITVGGPGANLVTEYFNEFTDAFFVWGIPDYFGMNMDRTEVDEYRNKILALTCWSKNVYARAADKGYAVIATYCDINGTKYCNGTKGLIIWGLLAEDTYWACRWIHEVGIHKLQDLKPGVTAIILEIDYTDFECEPTITIVEELGTISETGPADEGQKPPHVDP